MKSSLKGFLVKVRFTGNSGILNIYCHLPLYYLTSLLLLFYCCITQIKYY